MLSVTVIYCLLLVVHNDVPAAAAASILLKRTVGVCVCRVEVHGAVRQMTLCDKADIWFAVSELSVVVVLRRHGLQFPALMTSFDHQNAVR